MKKFKTSGPGPNAPHIQGVQINNEQFCNKSTLYVSLLKKRVGDDLFYHILSFSSILFFNLSLIVVCNIQHAWWSTQSRLATLLSSLIARRWVGLQTI